MQQVFMRKRLLKSATVGTEQVPLPKCAPGGVLISNRFSLISAGTESSAVRRNVKDMVVKAMTDPGLRQSVVDMLLKDGIARTADRVNYETTKWTPLGYSGVGIALEVGREVEGIRPGDLVAYGGEGHAEFIHVPKNLCVAVPSGVSAPDASFVALGSIALQAARRASIEVGDWVAVVGQGLVGQLVAQMVRAAGGRVIAIDTNPQRLELAATLGTHHTLTAGPDVPQLVRRLTAGRGADRVLMCASTTSNEVIEQAIDMARDRGRIVMVGFVGMDVPPDPFYRKELELVVSRSYGPGRYDPAYEQQGHDYPVSYVRWTENRNMGEFLSLLADGRVQVAPLISRVYDLEYVAEAYRMLVEAPGGSLGIVLRYPETAPEAPTRTLPVASTPSARVAPLGRAVRVAVVGCGSFARQFHMPNLKANPLAELRCVVATTGQTATEMAARYGATSGSTDLAAVLADPQVDATCVFTRDASHARTTLASLRAGKHVFCEKPLAISEEECRELVSEARTELVCMTGFNRRFAPLSLVLRENLRRLPGPRMMIYRVNAGAMPRDSWIYDPRSAAGRIVGEVCHFVDLLGWLTGAEPVSVSARSLGHASALHEMEDVTAHISYSDGSVGTVIYACQGAVAMGKERLEVHTAGTSACLDDFLSLSIAGGRPLKQKLASADKGHRATIQHFLEAASGQTSPQITLLDGVRATLLCLAIWESARSGGEPIELQMPSV